MKLYKFIFFSIILNSCNGTSKQNVQSETTDINWQIEQVIKQTHIYSKSGLLTETFKNQTIYVNGKVGVVLQFFITRDYDSKNNLVREMTFNDFKKNELFKERIFKYDANNNIIEEIEKSENVTSSITKKTYNELNQEIKRVEILKNLELDPEGWNLDSAFAHENDKKPDPTYHTVIIKYSYNNQGKLIKEQYISKTGEVGETNWILYNDGQKIIYSINPKSDTTSITKFEKDGNLIVETKEDKLYPFLSHTTWYEGKNKVKEIFLDKQTKRNFMEVYKYDERDNEIEIIKYK